jgi:hypothetical protein
MFEVGDQPGLRGLPSQALPRQFAGGWAVDLDEVGYPAKCSVVSQFESRDWEADLWSLVTPTTRRADRVQPRLRATSAQAILKNVGGDFAAWQNLSTD